MANESGGAATAAPLNVDAVRAALLAETVPQVKDRIAEANVYRESCGLPRLVSSGPKARLIDALVAAYAEAGLDTETALEPPTGEGFGGDDPEPRPEPGSDHAGSLETADEPEAEPPGPGKDLVPLKPPETVMPSQQEYVAMRQMADQLCKTEFVPKDFRNRPEAVLASILTGRELGIGPMQALKDISIIDGRPALSASLMMALMRKGGVVVLESESTKERAFIRAQRKDTGEIMAAEWTMEDAQKITRKGKPLTAGDNWQNYPADMLWARCVGRLARRLAPDILGGMGYSAEEMADFDGGWNDEKPAQQQTRSRPTDWLPPADWRELHARFAKAIGGVDVSDAEATEWMKQAVAKRFDGRATADLNADEKGEAWQLFLRALLELEKVDGDMAFNPNAREIIAKALVGFGALYGPQWRLSPDETELPTYYEAHGLPEPTKPAADSFDHEQTVEEGEWSPTELTDEERAERQAAWDAYVSVERVNHPTWNYPDDVPDDWEVGTDHIPF